MVFCSFTFLLLFMPAVLMCHRVLPEKAKRPFLLAASLLFYGWGSPAWLLLLIYVMVLDWAGAMMMAKAERLKTPLLTVLIVLNLLPLAYFKYGGFLRDTLAAVGLKMAFSDPLLPAGISFFTFQGISYLIDVYRGEAGVQRRFVLFGVYLSLFPQLVAGPIVCYTDLEEQLTRPCTVDEGEMREGLRRFILGLAKKVLLADAMGRYWGKVSAALPEAGALGAWLGLIAFSFQIFFDFSGYSDMALGLGRCLGFSFPENFDRPYRAKSLTEFWRRWHMSLTTWFRKYVYIPLGGNRRGEGRRNLNLMIVWALTGLWHGAGWNFILWGVFFGVLLILEKKCFLNRNWYRRCPGAVKQAMTYLTVLAGWGIFSGKWQVFPAMLGRYGTASPRLTLETLSFLPMLALCAAICFLPRVRMPLRRWMAPVLMVLCLAALAAQGYAPFVYFQF